MSSQEPLPQFTVSYPPKEKKTLKREIRRTWEWLIFSWHNLKRIGGIREITSTLTFSLMILLGRTWRQWQYQRQRKNIK